MENLSEKEKMLWKQAKKRVGFRRHLFTYLIINVFVWVMYFMRHDSWGMEMDITENDPTGKHFHFGGPIFMTLGWGIGLAFHAYGTYFGSSYSAVEKEYEKLKNSQK